MLPAGPRGRRVERIEGRNRAQHLEHVETVQMRKAVGQSRHNTALMTFSHVGLMFHLVRKLVEISVGVNLG